MTPEPALEIVIPGKPRGQGSMQLAKTADGRDQVRYPDSTVNARNLAVSLMRAAWRGRLPITGPVAVRIVAERPRPANHYGTGRNAGVLKDWAPVWCPVPTDADKVARLVCDALTVAGVIEDDALVVALKVTKVWGAKPGATRVELWPLGDGGGE